MIIKPLPSPDKTEARNIQEEGTFSEVNENILTKNEFQVTLLQSINNKDRNVFDFDELSKEDFESRFDAEMLEGVKDLPENVSEKLGIGGVKEINNNANLIISVFSLLGRFINQCNMFFYRVNKVR